MLKQEIWLKDPAGLVFETAIAVATAPSRGSNADIFIEGEATPFMDLLKALVTAHRKLMNTVDSKKIGDVAADMIWDAATRVMVADARPYLFDRGLIPVLVDRLKDAFLVVMDDAVPPGSQTDKDASKDLVILCGDHKNTMTGLLHDKTKQFLVEHPNANILLMCDEDQADIFKLGSRIPVYMEDSSACRGSSMRTMARLDPDLVVIDEIKTPDEARAVVMLAETGHQVFASIHSASEEESLALWDDLTKEFKALSPEFFRNRVSINWVCEYPPEFPVVGHTALPVLACPD